MVSCLKEKKKETQGRKEEERKSITITRPPDAAEDAAIGATCGSTGTAVL